MLTTMRVGRGRIRNKFVIASCGQWVQQAVASRKRRLKMMLRRELFLMLVIPGLVLAADPLVGTWKLNVAKSTFSPGPGPKGTTVTYEADGEWVVTKAQRVDPTGKATTGGNRYKYDGKEYPYEGPYG